MKKQIVILALLLPAIRSLAQEQPTLENLADKRYERFEFVSAAPIYERIIKEGKEKAQVHYKLGYCYEMMQQYENAINTYRQYMYMSDSADVKLWTRIGDMQKIMKRYEEAKWSYNRYAEKTNDYAAVAKRIAGCDSAKIWLSDTAQKLSLVNERLLNTDVSDWGVSFNGNKLVFTSDHPIEEKPMSEKERARKTYGRNGHAFLKMYVADTIPADKAGDSVRMEIKEFRPGGDTYIYHAGPATFTANGDTAYFTVTNEDNDLLYRKAITRSIGTRKLELYYSVRNSSGNWLPPVAFAYNKVKYYSVGHAALAKNGSVLYFASDMPGGYGGTDIWFCRKTTDGKWATPVNCGPVINTAGQEVFPTIVGDTALYFSSTEHAGLGGLDIFSSIGSDTAWQQPVNLKLPFNSSYDDFYCAITDRTGYLASDREGGLGSDDIYSFLLPPVEHLLLDNTVYSRKDSTVLKGAHIEFSCMAVAVDTTCSTDAKGNNLFEVKKNNKYVIRASYPGYVSNSIEVATSGYKPVDTVYSKLYLAPVPPPVVIPAKPVITPIPDRHFEVGETFVLDKLYYDTDKYNIRPDAAKELDKLVAILMKYPTIEIELSSHTDSRGSDQHNMVLSQNRAKSAVQYLIKKGIAANRVVAAGYGETRLTNGCANGVKCSAKEHQMNRRTEVKILKN